MAIQQGLQFSIQLTGDGNTSVFIYAIGSLFTLASLNQNILNPGSTPVSVSLINPDGVLPSATVSVDIVGNIIITFSSPPLANVTGLVTLQIFFASNIPPTVNTPITNVTGVELQQVNDSNFRIMVLLECIRRAVVALACDGAHNKPMDFDPTTVVNEVGVDNFTA